MDIEQGKERGVTGGDPHKPGGVNYPPQQATGAADYPPKPVTGFPEPGPPPVTAYPPPPGPGYPVSEGAPAARERELPCCGLGWGWILFILGFILGIIPWYIGAIMLLCYKRENYKREKVGFIFCAVFAVIGTVLIVVSLTTKYEYHHGF